MDGENNSSSMSLTSNTCMEKLMSPKSPLPGFTDFHGKRKQMVKIQVLEKEICLLQEELKSLEGIHPASTCCKELDAFVGSISDPFTFIGRKHMISESHYFGKQISLPWRCCSCNCLLPKKIVKECCSCCSSSNSKCFGSICLKTTSTLSKIVAKF